jgi:hypothetical protein
MKNFVPWSAFRSAIRVIPSCVLYATPFEVFDSLVLHCSLELCTEIPFLS